MERVAMEMNRANISENPTKSTTQGGEFKKAEDVGD